MPIELTCLVALFILIVSFIVCMFSFCLTIVVFKAVNEINRDITRHNEVFLEYFKSLKNVGAQTQHQLEIPNIELVKTEMQEQFGLLDVLKNAPTTNFGSRTNARKID